LESASFAFSPSVGRFPSKRFIFDLVRYQPGGVSRADLARQTGLTRSAITAIVNQLLESGFVREQMQGYRASNRKPVLLEINPAKGWVVGIDMGVTHLAIVVVDFSAHPIAEFETPFDITLGPEKCLDMVNDFFYKTLENAGLQPTEIMAVGLGVPGPVWLESGTVCSPPIMPGWHNYPIRKHLEAIWKLPLSLSNDAELGALGEWAYGAGRGEKNLIYIKVGSGVGCGLLLNGRIYSGARGCAGEIGHTIIIEGGPTCSCGNSGCLEAIAGGAGIARMAREAIANGRRTQLDTMNDLDKITARDVAAAARQGDLVAQQIISEAGVYLGTAIATLVNIINPGQIVVGGGVAQLGDLLLEPIRQSVETRSLLSCRESLRITAAVLGRRSSCMGAVVTALNLYCDRAMA
jgi:glucokinase-like ROK family protein